MSDLKALVQHACTLQWDARLMQVIQNTILQSLAPYRVDENSISLTQTILGRGGFGVVLLGEMGPSIGNPKGSTLVAVKQLHATGTEEENKMLAIVRGFIART